MKGGVADEAAAVVPPNALGPAISLRFPVDRLRPLHDTAAEDRRRLPEAVDPQWVWIGVCAAGSASLALAVPTETGPWPKLDPVALPGPVVRKGSIPQLASPTVPVRCRTAVARPRPTLLLLLPQLPSLVALGMNSSGLRCTVRASARGPSGQAGLRELLRQESLTTMPWGDMHFESLVPRGADCLRPSGPWTTLDI